MIKYTIKITRKAQKALAKIPVTYQEKTIEAIYALSENPYPNGSKKLTNREAWRIRVGVYRVIYEVHEDILSILVIQIGHRKNIYQIK